MGYNSDSTDNENDYGYQIINTNDNSYVIVGEAGNAPNDQDVVLIKVDSDGNEIGGIIAPEISVPIAAHTGWTLRHADIGGESQLLMFAGGTIPFPATESARLTAGDPRPSIESRYMSRDEYLSKVRASAEVLVSERYLLETDIETSVSLGERMWNYFTVH